MPRLILSMSFREFEALIKLALAELRNPRDQARYIIQKELCRLGLLKDAGDNLPTPVETDDRCQNV